MYELERSTQGISGLLHIGANELELLLHLSGVDNFFCKGPNSIFGFASHKVSIATIQVCSVGEKTAIKATIDNM